jgi:hypothetical protein
LIAVSGEDLRRRVGGEHPDEGAAYHATVAGDENGFRRERNH